MTHETPGLLISVRSAEEALAALAGGATLIDVKEPGHGPLGRAAPDVIAAVVAAVAGRCPVSAALGELDEPCPEPLPAGLSLVKWGLAGCAAAADWRAELRARQRLGPAVVAVAYADWQCARAPSIDDVFAFAAERAGSVLLVDTCCKDRPRPGAARPTLLDWLRLADVLSLCARCRAHGIRIALAGSLAPAEIALLGPARPDWFAIRGAACEGGRQGIVSTERVRALAKLIQGRARAHAD